MKLPDLAMALAGQFQTIYGRAPRWFVAAPGRVNVIGEHTDYNDGFVLPMAIDRYTVMAADLASAPSKAVSITDVKYSETAVIDVSNPVRKGSPKWSNYVRGVIAGFQQRGLNIPALDVAMFSTVPLGGGLSSSAALEVCTATLIETVTSRRIEPVEKALLCQKAEHEFAGVPCGIMDQFISVMGRENHLLLLDCRSRETQFIPVNDSSVKLMIINSNLKHELGNGEYAKRRAQCETAAKILEVGSLRDVTIGMLDEAKGRMDGMVFRRARHVISEIERTLEAASEISRSNWEAAGSLMYASHVSLRDDYEVSCRALDAIVEIAKDIGIEGGVYGCRMTGGGFGGCCVALVKAGVIDTIIRKITAGYKATTGINSTIFASHPAAGAIVIKG